MPEFSIIVLFDRAEFEPCLSSLLSQKGPSFEIIGVIAPGTKKPEVGNIVKFLELSERNPAYRRNQAVLEACGDYIAFIDDDAYAPPLWLKDAKEIFETHPEYSGIGGVNIAPEEQRVLEWISDVILSTPLIGSGNPTYREARGWRDAHPGEIHLTNFFVKREVFQRIGGFNEKLGYGAEDSEFIWYGNKLGYRFGFFPSLAVRHRRRAFGWSYIKQRFWFRRQSARLLVLNPGFYGFNPSLIIAGFGTLVLIFILIYKPIWVLFLAIIYFFATISLSFKKAKKRIGIIFILPFCFLVHHLVYGLGLFFGIIEGLVLGRNKLRQKLSR